jgi:hypothetical protein
MEVKGVLACKPAGAGRAEIEAIRFFLGYLGVNFLAVFSSIFRIVVKWLFFLNCLLIIMKR